MNSSILKDYKQYISLNNSSQEKNEINNSNNLSQLNLTNSGNSETTHLILFNSQNNTIKINYTFNESSKYKIICKNCKNFPKINSPMIFPNQIQIPDISNIQKIPNIFPPYIPFQLYPNIPYNSRNYSQNDINLDKKDNKTLYNLTNSSSQETTSSDKNKKKSIIFRKINNRKGRKSKETCGMTILSKHTKYSSDNMMRKIKNKIIESSRQLANKLLLEEINNLKNKFKFPYKEFRKIKGSFSQELNIKFNLWFYQIKISDIFSLEISTKYSQTEKLSNKELIEYIFNINNINNFPKTKQILNMPFHQYYHDIFLSENITWMQYFNIKQEDNKYNIDYLLYNLDDKEDIDEGGNKVYINKIKKLAENYEDFFLFKKMRNVDLSDRKNEFIKNFMNITQKNDYLQYNEKVKQIKNYYINRKLALKNTAYINMAFFNPINNFNDYKFNDNTYNNSFNAGFNINNNNILNNQKEEKKDNNF